MKGWLIELHVTGEDPVAGDILATAYELALEHEGRVIGSFAEPRPIDELAELAHRRRQVDTTGGTTR